METDFDLIVLGTGLTETIIASLMVLKGKKVLILDRNTYYGGEIASLNLNQMFDKFKGLNTLPPTELGSMKEYNIDLIPKFIMSNGKLAQIIRATGITRSGVELSPVGGIFVFHNESFQKVPVMHGQIINSSLVSGSEPIKTKQLLNYLYRYDQNDPSTHEGLDCSNLCIEDVFHHFNTCQETCDYLGHVVAMYSDNSFLKVPAIEFMERVSLYEESLNEHGKSPFIYPMYGLGELAQAFIRKSSMNGATCMLGVNVDRILNDENGNVCGVEFDGKAAKCKMIVCNSSYIPNNIQKNEKVIQAICILSHHPVTITSNSCQIIIPKPNKHNNDIYCNVLHNHKVAPNGKFLAYISTVAETQDPESEIKQVLDLLEPIDEKFVSIREILPKTFEETMIDGVFVTKSYDASMHLESCADDIEDLYERICGEKLNFSKIVSSFLTEFQQDNE